MSHFIPPIEFECKVIRVMFPKPGDENAWHIIRTDRGTIMGEMSWTPKPNEQLILKGRFQVKGGDSSFRFTEARANIPISPRAVLKYCCEMTNGVGPVLEDLIWETWGAEWQRDIGPAIIKGLNGTKYSDLMETLDDFAIKQVQAETVAWLIDKGVTVNMATVAFVKWQKETISVVNANCYQLADLPNYGFKDVDGLVRQNFGIEFGDKRRINAGVVYSVKQANKSGSTIIEFGQLCNTAQRALNSANFTPVEDISQSVRDLIADGVLIALDTMPDVWSFGGQEVAPITPGNVTLATARDHANAQTIWRFVNV